jgi:hypothetical protein
MVSRLRCVVTRTLWCHLCTVHSHHHTADDMGPVVTGSADSPVYNFTVLDILYDAIQHAGVTPIVELR